MAKIVNVATMPETIATSSRALAVGSGDFEQLKEVSSMYMRIVQNCVSSLQR